MWTSERCGNKAGVVVPAHSMKGEKGRSKNLYKKKRRLPLGIAAFERSSDLSCYDLLIGGRWPHHDGFLILFDFFLLLGRGGGVTTDIAVAYCPGIIVEPAAAQHGVADAGLFAVVIYGAAPNDGTVAEKGAVFDSGASFSRNSLVEDARAVICLVVFEIAILDYQVAHTAATLVVYPPAVHFGIIFIKIAVQHFGTAAVSIASIIVETSAIEGFVHFEKTVGDGHR